MVRFVNAKLNLGLNIVRKRPDGYHELETLFYPVGLYNGTPQNPEPFCDILEIVPAPDETETVFRFSGNNIDCPLEKNLVFRAYSLFKERMEQRGRVIPPYMISLEKHIPDGAGLGGGSADASFTLMLLNELEGFPLQETEMLEMALSLGADCPFFIENRPMLAEGIGEVMTQACIDLSGCWALIVKPDIFVSTREAFANITPEKPEKRIADIISKPLEQWEEEGLKNDFEKSIFPQYPEIKEIKQHIKTLGASYVSMSGSGASVFGIFKSRDAASAACNALKNQLPSSAFITLSKL